MTLILDPSGSESWMADDLASLFPGMRAATFDDTPGENDVYTLSQGQTFWNSSNVELHILREPTGNRISRYRFIRSASPGVLSKIAIENVSDRLDISVDYMDNGEPLITRIARSFEAVFDLGHRTLGIVLTPMGRDQLELDAWFDTGHGPSLGDLFQLLGYASGAQGDIRSDLEWLPEELRTGSVVEISSFHAMLQHHSTGNDDAVTLPGQRSGGTNIQNIRLNLSFLNGHSWNLIPGHDVLKVGQLTAALDVDEPLDPDYRFPRIDVGGVITIEPEGHDKAEIELHARWPDYAVSGILREGQEIPLRALLAEFGVPAGKHPDALTINELSLQTEPIFIPRSFSLSLGVANVWEIELGKDAQGNGKSFKIEQINVYADYKGGDEGHMTGRLFGRASIGNQEFLLSAEASNQGWAFSGSTYPKDDTQSGLKAGEWLETLATELGLAKAALPQQVHDFEITRIALELHTANNDLRFTLACKTTLDGSGTELDAELTVHYARQASDGYQLEIEGHLTVGYRRFDLFFAKSGGDTRLLAIYASQHKDALDLGALLTELTGSSSVPKLEVELSAIELALDTGITAKVNNKDVSAFLLNVDMGGSLNLADLPLVGAVLQGDKSVLMALQVLYSRIALPKNNELLGAINSHLAEGITPIPADKDIAAGFRLSPRLQIGDTHYDLELPVSANADSGQLTENGSAAGGAIAPASNDGATNAGDASWFSIQKQLGPVYLSRVGGRYADSELTFLIDAALSLGPLTFSMDGLSVTTPLTEITPRFSLNGIGLDVKSGPMEIAGSFLHEVINGIDTYSGAAVLRFKELTLSAIGSYAEVNGQKSLFLYAVLNYPIGGPSFFFVEGLAAGFGYNRAFLAPPITGVEHFPLIEEARRGAGLPADISSEIRKLNQYIPFRPDQYFLVAGIKFNSFKLIDSFAMVAVSFGKHFEINVLGISTLVLPKPDATPPKSNATPRVSPLAVIEMAISATFDPDAGLIEVRAALTPKSHIFSESCRLTGGFLFRSWFSGPHSGDFVLSLGGFHPHYVPQPHYLPAPDRVALNWNYDPHLQIKGNLYFALTPSAVMAGGHLSATYYKGKIEAHFNAGADFLLQWKPYHYEASVYINVGGTYHANVLLIKKVSLDIGASLQLWGPDLGGIATVHILCFSFDIDFGSTVAEPPPLLWDEFSESFLPEQVVTSSVASGLVETIKKKKGQQEIAVVNPQSLHLVTDSVIPSKRYVHGNGVEQDTKTLATFSPAPMKIAATQFKSVHTVTITIAGGNGVQDVTDQFALTPRTKRLPKAMWEDRSGWAKGKKADLAQKEERLDETLSGFDIRAKEPRKPASSPSVDKDKLIDAGEVHDANWSADQPPVTVAIESVNRRDALAKDILADKTAASRSELMKAFGLDADYVNLRSDLAPAFRVAPTIQVPASVIS